MNKIVKNIEKWLLLVLVSYLVVFATAFLIENEIGIINSVKTMQYADNLNEISLEEFSEIAKDKEETFEEIENSITNTEEQDSSNLKKSIFLLDDTISPTCVVIPVTIIEINITL